ncbi:penicillin-binding protein 2 [Kordiimonas laminariae]|uniref:penicillin-binding protein 2 n=1 Tax=Kordiimonas laminariae TaxID=2917717 RepID=UPI001FF4E6BE|nr:penicillin-binding protein 2 [Kordiimonas laminariae]MCK0068504.1 penicillin-binding protein 2 [Kordiimonas laminariae]
MAREGLRYHAFSRRAFILAGAQGLAVTALGGRLYYLSIVNGEKYKLRADKNRISVRLLAPVRGEIFDRKMRKIATNRRDFSVYLIPEQAKEVANTLTKLNRIVKISDRRLKRIERQIKRQRKFLPITVAKGLDWKTFSRVNVDMPNLPGVETNVGLSRFYPNGQSVAHIVGYLASPGENDVGRNPLYQLPGAKVGRQGIEKRFEEELRGEAGTRRVEVNAIGREIRELPPRQEALKGQDLHLTLDMDLQEFTLDQLGEESAGVVVMDVKNGDVLSLASAPTFDPNEFTSGISSANWQGLLNDPRKPLLNKCMTGQYPPGSTVKMVIALAALEQGIITPETKFFCNGKHRLGNNLFHCWQRNGHGHVNLLDAISKSCDVYFYEIAEKLDIDIIAEMAKRFGLGQTYALGVDGEKEGLVPDRQWKRVIQNQPWHLGETLNVSIGQGAMLATPLQLAVMTSRIASGNEVTPRLIRYTDELDFDPNFSPMEVNPLMMRLMRRGMEMVMEPKGTAHDYRRSKSAIKQAGKTGTAQVRRISRAERESGVLKNDEKPWAARDHALFVGYAPAENPEVAVSVLVQHGGGGASKAAPIGRAVLDKALELKDKPALPPVEQGEA